METVLVLDAGTTGLKAALVDRGGRILRGEYREYRTRSAGNRAEQYPKDWWEAAVAAISSLRPYFDDIEAISMSGQMQDLIPLPRGRDPLGSDAELAILYSDTRATAEAEFVEKAIGAAELQRVTGNVQDASGILAKLLWLKVHEPSFFEKTEKILFGAHDYISWKLTSSVASDLTTLSTTGLLDLENKAYAFAVLDKLGIPRDILPEIAEAGRLDGRIRPEVSKVLGIKSGTPVFHGAGDVGCTTLGAGAGLPGSISCYLGTSGWLATTAAAGRADPAAGIYNLRHPDPSAYIRVGPMLTAAGNIDWVVGAMAEEGGFEGFNRAVAGSEPGKLLYLPYLAGERAPFKDPNARGAFIGIERSSTKGDLYRAVLEGVAFALRSIYEAGGEDMPGRAGQRRFSLSGGGAKSPVWPQILADVFGLRVDVLRDPEMAGLRGAFSIAAKGLGWSNSYTIPDNSLEIAAFFVPIDRNTVAYQKKYAIFRGLYPALRSSFSALAG